MATLTGTNLLDSIIESTGIAPSGLIQATLAARLQLMIEAGITSKLTLAAAIGGFSPEINAGVEISDLSTAVETNSGLIEDAADEAAIDDIVFPPVTVEYAPVASYTITAGTTSVTEGESVIFTVSAFDADGNPTSVSEETTLTYQVQGVETDVAAAATPLDDLGVLNGTVTFEAHASSGTFTLSPANENQTEGFEAFKVVLLNADNTAGPSTANILIQDPENAGRTLILTTGADTDPEFTAGAGDDIFKGTGATFTALDTLDGGDGDDLLRISDVDGVMNTELPNGVSLTDIETVEIATAGNLGEVASGAVSAKKEIDTWTIEDTATDTFDVTWDGNTLTTAASDGSNGADLIVAAVNALAGYTAASNVGGKVVISSQTAGEALPVVTIADNEEGGDNADPSKADTQAAVAGSEATTAAVYDLSNFADIETINITGSQRSNVKASATADVNISNSEDDIVLDGGNNVVVTADADSQGVDLDNAAGTVTVNYTKQGAEAITIDDGTDISVTTSVTTGTTTIGGADEPTGTVTVDATAEDTTNGTSFAMGAITITGGTSVDVSTSAGSTDASEFAAATTITQSAVTVNGDGNTTDVTVTQDAAATANGYVKNVDEVKESTIVTFKALAKGEKAVLTDGTDALTFTAAKALDADDVAQAFADLTKSDLQTAGGIVANGVFTSTDADGFSAEWTSGAASGATVTFTGIDDSVTDLAFTGSTAGKVPTQVKSAGTAKTTGETGKLGVAGGVVSVDDSAATSSITTITLDGYGDASSIVDADALATLNLSNVNDCDITVDTVATTLALMVDNVTGASVIDLDETSGTDITELTITTGTTASVADIEAAGVTDLTVNGSSKLTTSAVASVFTALETVTITGDAGLVLTGAVDTTLQTINAAGTTGDVTATIDTDVTDDADIDTAYTGGSGVDTVTLADADAVIESNISLGDGNDKLTFVADTASIDADVTVDGGDGDEDTIQMEANDGTSSAENLDDSALDVVNFERLVLTGAADAVDINVGTMGFDYVTVAGVTDGAANDDTFTLTDIANNGTVVVSAQVGDGQADATDTDKIVVTVKDADLAENTSNVLNIELDSGADGTAVDADTLQVDDVETINITSTDTFKDVTGAKDEFGQAIGDGKDDNDDDNALILSADTVTSVTIDGSADTTFVTATANLETINAGAMTGGLTHTTTVVDLTITTGEAADAITLATNGVDLTAGDGDDIITINDDVNLLTIDGGEGEDTFIINGAASNKDSYAVFENVGSGDVFDFGTNLAGDVGDFVITEVTLAQGASESSQALLNQAVKNLDQHDMGWFEFNNNTFIVIDKSGSTEAFEDGTDVAIMLTGVYDLSSGASFNSTTDTLEIV